MATNLDNDYIIYVNDCVGRINQIMPLCFNDWVEQGALLPVEIPQNVIPSHQPPVNTSLGELPEQIGDGRINWNGETYVNEKSTRVIPVSDFNKATYSQLQEQNRVLREALEEAKRMYDEVQPAGGWQGVYEQIESALNSLTK